MVSRQKTFFKLLRHPLGITGAVIIFIFLIMAIAGNLICLDKTKDANQISLPIALLPPMSKVKFIEIEQSKSKGVFHNWLYGKDEPFSIPVQSYTILNDTAFVQVYGMDSAASKELVPLNGPYGYSIVEKTFYLGTDGFGRDVMSRIILGSRVSLSVGAVAVVISLLIGSLLGLMAGYFGGGTDKTISWLINVIWSLPTMLLVVAISFAMGKGFWQIFIAIGLSSWVEVARIVRGQVFSIREKEYIQAARVLGFGPYRIMLKHILPNLRSSLIVLAVSIFGTAILLESGLSFLGLGLAPPAPSWGMMIKENYPYIMFDSEYLAIVPGLVIMLLVMGFNFLGIALRDALDIHLQDT
jgi:peptide/nickel transport system permease protein